MSFAYVLQYCFLGERMNSPGAKTPGIISLVFFAFGIYSLRG